jgi:serine/threonine-protein kinase
METQHGSLPPGARDRIAELFAEALRRSPSERDAFLAAACADNEELHADVRSLLSAHRQSSDFLRRVDPAWYEGLWLEEMPEDGATIGQWRILSTIGRGGTGIVYLAERANSSFAQRIALKVLRIDASPSMLRRFHRERRILALLDHPSIARLLDGGTTESARPWLGVEYVEGESVTNYCDERRLDIRERLRLFAEVCEAVQYAHAKLVIHRDLKPANVFVTKDGRVKLLDFGIARLLDSDTADETVTSSGLRPLTPEYAAPEQVCGEQVTTAADVYALGVLLYELLCGERPHRFPQRSLEAIAHVVRNQLPRLPSTVASELHSAGHERIAAMRTSTSAALRRQLCGDLDAIVRKSLRVEPEKRYASAEALLNDVQRHLDGRPVSARSGTFAYVAHRFARRHRIAVAAAGVGLFALLIGAAGTAWQARRADAQRDVAVREAAKAEQVSEFMTRLFRLADPNQSQGATLTVREAVDSGRAWVSRDLAEQPELRAELTYRLADVYFGLGLHTDAQALWQESLRTLRGLDTHRNEHVLRTLLSLSMVMRARGATDSAIITARRGLELLRTARLDLPNRAMTMASALNRLADALREHGELEEADSLLRRSLHVLPPANGSSEVANLRTVIMTNLAHLRRTQGDSEEAEELHRSALAMRRELWGVEHPEVSNSLINLANALADQDEFAEAESLFRRGLAMRVRLQGELHPDYGIDLAAFAGLLHRMGALDEAVQTYRHALGAQRAAIGPETPWGVATRVGLGNALLALGLRDEAQLVLREALRIAGTKLESGHRYAIAARVALQRATDQGEH